MKIRLIMFLVLVAEIESFTKNILCIQNINPIRSAIIGDSYNFCGKKKLRILFNNLDYFFYEYSKYFTC